MAEDETRHLVNAFNDTAVAYPVESTVIDLFEVQAAHTPEAEAVRCGAQTLTYAELDRLAGQMAQRLATLGAAPERLVGICLEHSVEMVAAVLAVLKAGAAYVPLDPGYPRARLAAMIDEVIRHAPAGCPLVLAQHEHFSQVESFGVPVVDLAEAGELPAGDAVPATAVADDLAYVIFTSGSTGRPKGVMVTHANLVSSTTARFTVYPEAVGRFLLLSSFAFDSSLVGIFWTLCQGGTLVLPPAHAEQDIDYLAGMIEEQRITHLLCLPSLYELLLTYAKPVRLASLSTVIVAGEVCPRRLAQRHLAVLPGAQLYNEYGPTEATVWSTVYAVPRELPPGPVAIGRPIPNLRVYVLDDCGQLAPIGVPGELYVGGIGLASGYLGQPQLTASRFVMHEDLAPALLPGAQRLYRTGDLVRYRADGNLEYLGRVDQQVKIRGYRIELEEVERTLAEYPGVGETVVVAKSMAVAPSGPEDELSLALLADRLCSLDTHTRNALLAEVEGLSAGEAAARLSDDEGR